MELFPSGSGAVWLAALLASALTILLKTGPVLAFKGDTLPPLLRRWLDFVPVAVMAALVGPDVFIYEGQFNLSTTNLFLLVSCPTLLVAWWSRNYFLTIAAGIGLVILARYFGLAS